MNGIIEKTKNSSQNDNSSNLKEISEQNKSKNKKTKIRKNNQNLVKKSHQKELRKINKECSKKPEKKITLIRPNMFEADSSSTKNVVEKKDTQIKNQFPFPNYNNKMNINYNLFNNEITKRLNIFNQNNILKFPIIPFSQKITNNNTINDSNIICDYKQKFFTPKPQNTFNVLKFNSTSDLSLEEKNNNSSAISNKSENLDNKNISNPSLKYKNIRKGRKSKKFKNTFSESKHTKFSEDNMMRKIKNKVIESSRLLANKLFMDESRIMNDKYYFVVREFRKIKGSFSQELNIKFNLYFYQMKIKDIFSLELSHKYTAIEKNSNTNKDLIDYIFSEPNKDYFINTKKILSMPFHQYYHDIFLGEDKNWKKIFGIEESDDKYQIENLLNSLQEKTEENKNDINTINNEIYAKNINTLAHHYEDFFLTKKTRNVGLGDKKEGSIKLFMETTTDDEYKNYFEQLKQFKTLYETRAGFIPELKNKNPFILNHNLFKKDNLLINEKNNNHINNNNFDNLTLVKSNTNSTEKKQINNKENDKESNNKIKLLPPKNVKEVLFKVNIERENDFCGKKRKFEIENMNDGINKDLAVVEI